MTNESFMSSLRLVGLCTCIGVLCLAVMWWVQVEQSVQQALVLQVATGAVGVIVGFTQKPK